MIEGGIKLSGAIKISGAKNAALPIMAASLLPFDGQTKIGNLPMVADVLTLKSALEKLGARFNVSDSYTSIDANEINNTVMPIDDTKKMRASFFVTGALLAKFGEVTISQPGGCVIGKRPIDFHLAGFQALGAKIERANEDCIKIKADKLKGAAINLPFPSVGATENLMMSACLAEGQTIINNSALEPEIVDLATFLKKMGARIKGDGTSIIKIDGVKKLNSVDHKIIPDRIEAGSFMIAAAITGGDITINNVVPEHLSILIDALNEAGANAVVKPDGNSVVVNGKTRCNPLNVLTAGFPGFPTDLQPLLASLLSLSTGHSTITDTIFPSRFCYVTELRRLGADITVIKNSASIRGVKELHGAEVYATDLRGGFALILAGLIAKYTTTIKNVHYIDRGYENLTWKLQELGANIIRERSNASEEFLIPSCKENKKNLKYTY